MKNQLVDENIPIDNVWQLQNKYIITEVNNGLIIIDQHVAHERILFESAKKALDGNGLPSQTVLFPQTVKFQPEEYVKFIDIVPYLNKIGFRMRDFGENTVIIEGIPSEIYSGTVEEILHDILDKYIDRLEINASFLDHMAATYACKSAIKAGERLKNDEMINLVDKLFATEHPYYCPHGRPIIISLSMDELDRRFERI
jgi:DNA mismatch repair protein MutL